MSRSKVVNIEDKLKQKQFEEEMVYLSDMLEMDMDDEDFLEIYNEYKENEYKYIPCNDDDESEYEEYSGPKELNFDDEY